MYKRVFELKEMDLEHHSDDMAKHNEANKNLRLLQNSVDFNFEVYAAILKSIGKSPLNWRENNLSALGQ